MLASVIQFKSRNHSCTSMREDVFKEPPTDEFLARLEDLLGFRRARGAKGAQVLTPRFGMAQGACCLAPDLSEESL